MPSTQEFTALRCKRSPSGRIVKYMMVVTQAEYDAIPVKDPDVFYFIAPAG